jgi:K+ transporter
MSQISYFVLWFNFTIDVILMHIIVTSFYVHWRAIFIILELFITIVVDINFFLGNLKKIQLGSGASIVGIATGYRLDDRGVGV